MCLTEINDRCYLNKVAAHTAPKIEKNFFQKGVDELKETCYYIEVVAEHITRNT